MFVNNVSPEYHVQLVFEAGISYLLHSLVNACMLEKQRCYRSVKEALQRCCGSVAEVFHKC